MIDSIPTSTLIPSEPYSFSIVSSESPSNIDYSNLKQVLSKFANKLPEPKEIHKKCSNCAKSLSSDYSICLLSSNYSLCPKCADFHGHPLLKNNRSNLTSKGVLCFLLISLIYSKTKDMIFTQTKSLMQKYFDLEGNKGFFPQVSLTVLNVQSDGDTCTVRIKIDNIGDYIIIPGSRLVLCDSSVTTSVSLENPIEKQESEEVEASFRIPPDFSDKIVSFLLLNDDQVIITTNQCQITVSANESKKKQEVVETLLQAYPKLDKEKLFELLKSK